MGPLTAETTQAGLARARKQPRAAAAVTAIAVQAGPTRIWPSVNSSTASNTGQGDDRPDHQRPAQPTALVQEKAASRAGVADCASTITAAFRVSRSRSSAPAPGHSAAQDASPDAPGDQTVPAALDE